MEKTLIYRDQKSIDKWMGCYRQTVPVLQKTVDRLKITGIALTGDILSDLASGGDALRASVTWEIASERPRLLPALGQARMEAELLPLIDEAADEVRSALTHSLFLDRLTLNIDFFTCDNLRVGLAPDIAELLSDEFSLYDTDPVVAEAFRLATELRNQINDFEAYLRTHGDTLHPISFHQFGGAVGVITCGSTDGGAHAELYRWAFNLVRHRHKTVTPKGKRI